MRVLNVTRPNTTLKQADTFPIPANQAAGVRQLDGSVLVCGGQRDYSYSNTTIYPSCYSVDPASLAVRDAPPLPVAVYGHQMILAGGEVYCLGGSKWEHDYHGINDVYRLRDGAWTPAPPMTTARVNFAAVLFDGSIYAIGGVGGDNAVLSSVEVFNVRSQDWSSRASMPKVLDSHSAAVYQKRIWVCGGYMVSPSPCYIYDPSSDGWSPGPNMVAERYQFGLVVTEGAVFAVGGQSAGLDAEDVGEETKFVAGRQRQQIGQQLRRPLLPSHQHLLCFQRRQTDAGWIHRKRKRSSRVGDGRM